ncbi:MAG: nucleoside hydrolase [Bacteroidota bacterium]
MTQRIFQTPFFLAVLFTMFMMGPAGCKYQSTGNTDEASSSGQRLPLVFDTDANNELDDQHALAYLLLNRDTFLVEGITVNSTRYGGGIEGHYREAERIMTLCGLRGEIPILKGAEGKFPEIRKDLDSSRFDGSEAVDFIIERARLSRTEPLLVIAVGKLTNLALALKKDSALTGLIRIVWLGSNYPEPGEYNQDNDTASLNYLLQTGVPFEMVTVRGGKPSGTAAVTVSQQEINQRMPGLGPHIEEPVTGRHGGRFDNFGDYSVSLFEHIDYGDASRKRALYDMAAVAIVKNPEWASSREIPAPLLMENRWVDRPDNNRTITIWENFRRDSIIADFYRTLEEHTPEGY